MSHFERQRIDSREMPNGPGAAAILAAAAGCFALAVLALLGDKFAGIRAGLAFYKPTGPLSGVTTLAIAVWLVAWAALEWRWRSRSVEMGKVSGLALTLLALSLLLVFPPIVDLL